MVVLGIDPGYAIVGYGILDYKANKFTTLGYGAIVTEAELAFERRLEIIYDDLCQIIDMSKPEAMAIEQLYFTTNQKTAIKVAEARGIIMLAAVKKNVPLFEYTPLQVKQSVVGYGKAVKSQVMEMTRVMLKLEKIPKPDDAADALAIAICHAHSAGSMMRKEILQNL